MSAAFWVAFYLVIFGLGRELSQRRYRKINRCFKVLRERRGGVVKEEPVGPFVNLVFGRNDPIYEVEIDGLTVTVGYVVKQGTFISISGDLPTDISIGPETTINSLSKLVGMDDPEIGQPTFDELAYLDGDLTQLLSYLNREARRATLLGLERGATLRNGEVKLQLDRKLMDVTEMLESIEFALDMATTLRRGERGQAGRLIHVIRTDTNRTIRENCLSALLRVHPNLAITRKFTQELLSDRSASIRFMAARSRRTDGTATLESLVTTPNTPVNIRVDALLLFLQRCHDRDVIHEVLEACMTGPHELILSALEIARSQDIVVNATLLDDVEKSDHLDVLKALAEYSVVVPNRRSMDRLARLFHSESADVIQAAGRSLGQIGTAEFVSHLQEAKSRLPRSAYASIDSAILAIQARVSPTLVGGLSIRRDADRGGLSVRDHDAIDEVSDSS